MLFSILPVKFLSNYYFVARITENIFVFEFLLILCDLIVRLSLIGKHATR